MAETSVPDVALPICQELVVLANKAQSVTQSIKECSGPLAKMNELNIEVKQIFKEIDKQLKLLRLAVIEQDKESEKERVNEALQLHTRYYETLQTALRRANLACKINMEKKETEERDELFKGGESALELRRRITRENAVKTSVEITDSLRNTTQLLAQNLQTSAQTLQTLSASSKTLKDVEKEYRNFQGVVKDSGKTLTKLTRRETTDRILISLGFVLFFSVVAYITYKRVVGFAAPTDEQ
eukprot:Colp12_sorted_trinity150504_noHs@27991